MACQKSLTGAECLRTVGISICLLFSVLCFVPSVRTHSGQVVLCREMEEEGRGLKTIPILSMPLLWSEHIMFLGKDLHLGLSCGDVSPGKCLWGGSHTSLGTADPGLCPSQDLSDCALCRTTNNPGLNLDHRNCSHLTWAIKHPPLYWFYAYHC